MAKIQIVAAGWTAFHENLVRKVEDIQTDYFRYNIFKCFTYVSYNLYLNLSQSRSFSSSRSDFDSGHWVNNSSSNW